MNVSRESLLQSLLAELVAELERRAPYAAALFTGSSGIRMTLDKREQSVTPQDPSNGVVFTVFTGEHLEEFAISDLEPDRLARAVRAWADSIRFPAHKQPLLLQRASPANAAPAIHSFQTPCQIAPSSLTLPEKLEQMRALQRRPLAFHSQITNARLHYNEQAEAKLFIGVGRQMTQEITRTFIFLDIYASDGSTQQRSWLSKTGTGGLELAQVSEDELAEASECALRLLDAEKIEPGVYDVVTDNTLSGTIAHECFGHGVELDLFPKGRAQSAAFFNQRVAAPGVEMYDDPTVPGAFARYFFDDEGQLATSTQILRDGILVAPLSDLMSATLTGRPRTANGRRESYARKSYARMSNTFFGPGDQTPAELIGAMEDGIHLRQAVGGMEDPLGWGIQVTAQYGEEIRHGRPTGRLFGPISITGYVPELLQSIAGIGNDLLLDGGWCGKGQKEWLPVSSGGPHLRMKARLG